MASIWGSDWCLILQVSSTLPPTLGQTSLGHFLPQSNPTQPPLPPTHPSNRQTSHTPHHLCGLPGPSFLRGCPGGRQRWAQVCGARPRSFSGTPGGQATGRGGMPCLATAPPSLASSCPRWHTRWRGAHRAHTARGAVVTTRAPPSSQTDETANWSLGHAPPHGGCRRGRRAAGDMKTSAEFGMELGQIGTCGFSLPHF